MVYVLVCCHLGAWWTSCTFLPLPCACWGSFPVLLGLWVNCYSPGQGTWGHSSSPALVGSHEGDP